MDRNISHSHKSTHLHWTLIAIEAQPPLFFGLRILPTYEGLQWVASNTKYAVWPYWMVQGFAHDPEKKFTRVQLSDPRIEINEPHKMECKYIFLSFSLSLHIVYLCINV